MKLTILYPLFLLLFLASERSASQTQPYSVLDNLHPVTPTAFQFAKYTEMPVSEYTGIPNISIPLYTISEDGVTVPLDLTYHAAGNRVNQDASWVGLGWDMGVGSIVQQINDQDDFAANTRRLPDFFNNGIPFEFPFKFRYCDANGSGETVCDYGCDGPISVNSPVAQHGFIIYTDSYAPFNGAYNATSDFFGDHDFNGHQIDSEPDIFTANFLGHSFKFIDDWTQSGHHIVVLNKKGYSVSRSGDTWTIVVPTGEQFDFAVKNVTQSYSSSESPIGNTTNSSILKPSSIVWMLTGITTKNKRRITFVYTYSAASNNCYPNFSQKRITAALTNTFITSSWVDIESACIRGAISDVPSSGTFSTRSFAQEPTIWLTNIFFPTGTVNFYTSGRSDVIGGRKLDSVAVSSASHLVKSYKFGYGYFDATSVGGNVYNGVGMSDYASYAPLRLKLLSLRDNSGATHSFGYSEIQLPPKNSFATDYWGFYNGQTSNTTAVPNPSQFPGEAGLGNNGDNHSANLTYCQAGILKQITYPTGGKSSFEYELNQFNNYYVPDFGSSANTVSSGLGLRIKSTAFLDAAGAVLKTVTYEYEGGKAILPLQFFRHFNYTAVPSGNLYGAGQQVLSRSFAMDEVNMSGFFSSNPFSSVNGVGYSKVTQKTANLSGAANGKTVSYFYNSPDVVYTGANTFNQFCASLPAIKASRSDPDNGSLKSEYYYDGGGSLLKKVLNTYSNTASGIYYGARSFPYGLLVRWRTSNVGGGMGVYHVQNAKSQVLVGYYPIFDIESLPTASAETDYFGADSLSVSATSSYNKYNFLSHTSRETSTGVQTADYTYVSDASGGSVYSAMIAANRLADLLSVDRSDGGSAASRISRTYKQSGGLFLADNDEVDARVASIGIPAITTYDLYDLSNGNVLQYTKSGLISSVIWDYGNEYVVAEVKNAPYASIAYTSFEADGKGRWKFSGGALSDAAAPTGKKAYSLSGGSVYRDSLDVAKKYVVSYWSKSGAQSVNGAAAVQGLTAGAYTYYEHSVSNPASGTITVSGTGTIDELRLYPSDAQMSTCTYDPLVGVTSRADAGGKISSYEYDAAWRLMNVRDQQGNIVKHTEYHYQGQ